MALTVPLCTKNGPHRVTKLAPGNRIPIDLDNKSSAPDTTATDIKTSACHPSPVDIAAALISVPSSSDSYLHPWGPETQDQG